MDVRKTALIVLVALFLSSATALCNCFAAEERQSSENMHQHHDVGHHESANQPDCEQGGCDDCAANHKIRLQVEFAVVPATKSACLQSDKPPQYLTSRPDEQWLDTWQPPPRFVLVADANFPNGSPVTRADSLLE